MSSPPMPAVQVTGLRKSFRVAGATVEAVSGIDLTVAAGEVFGLLGPNGAGKTTTLRILTTLLPADAGGARVAGGEGPRRTRARPAADRLRGPAWRGRQGSDRTREPDARRPAVRAERGRGQAALRRAHRGL